MEIVIESPGARPRSIVHVEALDALQGHFDQVHEPEAETEAHHHRQPEGDDDLEDHRAQVFEMFEEGLDRLGLAVFAQAEHFLHRGRMNIDMRGETQ